MKEILTCDIWTGVKMKVVIDRETGGFVLYNSWQQYKRFMILSNIANANQ